MPESLVRIDKKGGIAKRLGILESCLMERTVEKTEAVEDRLTERWDGAKRPFRIQIVGLNDEIMGIKDQ